MNLDENAIKAVMVVVVVFLVGIGSLMLLAPTKKEPEAPETPRRSSLHKKVQEIRKRNRSPRKKGKKMVGSKKPR